MGVLEAYAGVTSLTVFVNVIILEISSALVEGPWIKLNI